MLLTPQILTLTILNIIFLGFSSIAFVLSIKIFLNWDINKTTQYQYKLEKQSYLTATIIKYIFIVKLPLFLFFIFTMDKLSLVVSGAMCAAGVVNATSYGVYLLILKILNIYLFGFWLVMHKIDLDSELLPYTKIKFGFFLLLFILLAIEIVVEFMMFSSIDPNKLVDCCGVLYSSTSSSYISIIFQIDPKILVFCFYINFILIAISYYFDKKELFAFLNLVYLIISIITLIVFFGTYIYELPTHHCPFCMLQKDYYYIGYLIYALLFIGTFNGIVSGFFIFKKDFIKKAIIFDTLYMLLVSSYPIIYYIKNGVWL
jgi:hypothetical protein